MQKSTFFLSLFLISALLSGCTGTAVVQYGACTCAPPDTAPAETVPAPEGSVKTGLYMGAAASGTSASAGSTGTAKFDVTLAAVTVDEEGVILSCVLDSVSAPLEFDASGAVVSDLSREILTKNELGEAYGMVAYGGAKAEWNAQAAALADYAVGKTIHQLRNGAVNESGYAADADLATSATIHLGGLVSAIEAAVENAQYLGASAGDQLRLAVIATPGGTGAGNADGSLSLNVDAAALTMDGSVISSCAMDSLAAQVTFDSTGAITSGLTDEILTKNQLGDAYGMVTYGGAMAEWHVQAAAFCAYITGMTPGEVALMAVTESGAPADADLATSATISVSPFRALIARAAAQ